MDGWSLTKNRPNNDNEPLLSRGSLSLLGVKETMQVKNRPRSARTGQDFLYTIKSLAF